MPDGQTDAPDHLAKSHRNDRPSKAIAKLTSREYYCQACGARVTRSPDGEREYGHGRDCDHAVERVTTREAIGTPAEGGYSCDGCGAAFDSHRACNGHQLHCHEADSDASNLVPAIEGGGDV